MFKNIYLVPKYKKLDKTGKILYVLSFLVPITIIYTFFHLYFLPFGLNQDLTLESRGVYIDKEEEIFGGIAVITISPTIPKRDIISTASLKGENLYILKPVLTENDILNVWDFEKIFEEDFESVLLDQYDVKDEDLITFKLEVEIVDWEEEYPIPYDPDIIYPWNELLLKYKNLRIVRHVDSIELRVDEIVNEELTTFRTNYTFQPEDINQPLVLYASYKKPRAGNGFIELYVNNKLGGRVLIEEKELSFKKLDTIWNEELIKDLSQEHISLKQEKYAIELLETIPENLRDAVTLYLYYSKLFNPGHDEQEAIRKFKDPFELFKNKNFEYQEDVRIQKYYVKEFFDSFKGEISKLAIGYEYPFVKEGLYTLPYSETPFKIVIVGENTQIDQLNINLFKEPIWKKSENF